MPVKDVTALTVTHFIEEPPPEGSILFVKVEEASERECEALAEAIREVLPEGISVIVSTLDLNVDLLDEDQVRALHTELGRVIKDPDDLEDNYED